MIWALILASQASGPIMATPANAQALINTSLAGSVIQLAVDPSCATLQVRRTTAITLLGALNGCNVLYALNGPGPNVVGGQWGDGKNIPITFAGNTSGSIVGTLLKPGAATAGIYIENASGLTINNNVIYGSSGDGIDLGGAHDIMLIGNTCILNTVTAVHPDCIQGWGTAVMPILYNITMNYNTAVGDTQGFNAYATPAHDVTSNNNVYAGTALWAFNWSNCTSNCTIAGNFAFQQMPMAPNITTSTWSLNGATPPGNQDSSPSRVVCTPFTLASPGCGTTALIKAPIAKRPAP